MVGSASGAALDVPDHALETSWDCLGRAGNLSSVSGTYGLLAAMGPGFCAELVSLEWSLPVAARLE